MQSTLSNDRSESLPRENPRTLNAEIHFEDWGLIDYDQALSRQLELVERVARGEISETIVFCSHPAVVTLGRATEAGDVTPEWGGPTVEIQRGGRATYHGPSQVVVYPILNLEKRGRDLHRYLRALEDVVVQTLREYGIEAEGGRPEATGVWVHSTTGVGSGKSPAIRKVASIGIGVKRWVSYHGIAVNLDHDPMAFRGINPCGFSVDTMTSVEQLLNRKVYRAEFQEKLKNTCGNVFGSTGSSL